MLLVIFGEWHEKSPLARRGCFNATEKMLFRALIGRQKRVHEHI